MAAIERGPDPDTDGCCAWTRADLCRWLEAEHGKTHHPSSMSRVLRRLGFSRETGAALPSEEGPGGSGSLQKGGLADQVAAIAAHHPDKRIELWFADEARVGNKGRVCHRWWRRGDRPPGAQQLGYLWALAIVLGPMADKGSFFTAIRPATGEDVTLVLPAANTVASAGSSSIMSPSPARRTRISSWCSMAPAGT